MHGLAAGDDLRTAVGDLCVLQVESLESSPMLQVLETLIGHRPGHHVEVTEVDVLEVLETRSCDLGIVDE